MATGATQASAETASHLDQAWLADLVERLTSIHRPSASQGERRAAEWLCGRLRELGADARIEVEDAHGTFWWPLGIASGAAAVAGLAALRGRRIPAIALAAASAAAIVDETPPRRRRLRKLL